MSTSIGELEGTISLEDRFSHALELAGHVAEKVIDDMESGFKSVFVAAGAVGTAIAGITGTIVYMASKGSQLNDVESGFKRLAGGAEHAEEIFQALNKGVAGTVDSLELMEFANRNLQNGAIKTAEGFGTVTAAARVLSRQGFGEITTVMNQVSSALATGRTRQLQYLVGTIDLKSAEEKYAKSLGVTRDQLSDSGKRIADRIAIMDRLKQKVSEAGDVELSFKEKLKAATLGIENWFDEINKAVAASPHVNAAFDAIQKAILDALGGTPQKAIETVVGWVNTFADAMAHYGPIIVDWIAKIFHWIGEIKDEVVAAWNLVPDWFKNIAKDALLAGGAIYGVNKALGSISGGAAASGSGLGDAASVATILSGWQSVMNMAPKVGQYLGTVKDAFALLFAELALAYRTGGAIDVLKGLAGTFGEVMSVIIGSSFVTVTAGITAFGLALATLGESMRKVYNAWKDSASLWDFLRTSTGNKASQFGASPFAALIPDELFDAILRKIGIIKAKLGDIQLPKELGNIELQPDFTGPINENISEPLDTDAIAKKAAEAAKKIADATHEGIAKTQALWDEYEISVAKLTQGELAVRLATIDKWHNAELASLEKSKALNANYYNQLTALEEAYTQRKVEALKTLPEIQAKATVPSMGSLPGALNPRQLAQSLGQIDLDAKIITTTLGSLIPTAAAKAEAAIAAAMTAAGQSFLKPNAEQGELIDRMQELGFTAEETANLLGLSFDQVAEHVGRGTVAVETMLESIKKLPMLLAQAFTGGGGIGGAFKALAATMTNDLFGEGGPLANITKGLSDKLGGGLGKVLGGKLGSALGEGIASLLPGLGGLLAPLIGKLGSLLKGLFGGPSAQELAGRKLEGDFEKQFKSTADMIQKFAEARKTLGDTEAMANETATKWAKELWDAERQGGDAVQRVIDKIKESMDLAAHQTELLAEASSKYGPSSDDLEKAATHANELFEAMRNAGTYTQEQLDKAYFDMQKALADTGDAAAEAWVKAHGAITDFADAAEKAGYQTREALQKSAQEARKLAEYMRDSGKYTAEAVADAFKKADDAALASLGLSQKILDERKSLMKSIEDEKPEADMGAIEKEQRARLDAINKQVEAASKASQEAAAAVQANVGGAAEQAADATKNKFKLTINEIEGGWTYSTDKTADYITSKFDGIKIRIPIEWDVQPTPQMPGGAQQPGETPEAEGTGGVVYASGPMRFSTQGDEFLWFGGEGKGAPQPSRSQASGARTIQVFIGGKKVKDIMIDELERAPSDRDIRVLRSLR